MLHNEGCIAANVFVCSYQMNPLGKMAISPVFIPFPQTRINPLPFRKSESAQAFPFCHSVPESLLWYPTGNSDQLVPKSIWITWVVWHPHERVCCWPWMIAIKGAKKSSVYSLGPVSRLVSYCNLVLYPQLILNDSRNSHHFHYSIISCTVIVYCQVVFSN